MLSAPHSDSYFIAQNWLHETQPKINVTRTVQHTLIMEILKEYFSSPQILFLGNFDNLCKIRPVELPMQSLQLSLTLLPGPLWEVD